MYSLPAANDDERNIVIAKAELLRNLNVYMSFTEKRGWYEED